MECRRNRERKTPKVYGCGLIVIRCTAKDRTVKVGWRKKEGWSGRQSRRSWLPFAPSFSPRVLGAQEVTLCVEMEANNITRGNQVLIKVKRV